jgi:hypothetical protein
MSIHIIARVLPKRWGSPSKKIVAIKLADVANEDGGRIYPSIFTVASEAELSGRQVQRVIDGFRKAGLLIVVRPGGGRNRPTEYRFDLEAIERLPDAKPSVDVEEPQTEKPSQVNSDMVSPFKAETVTSATGKGDMGVTRPVLTRSIPYGEADASRKPIGEISPIGTSAQSEPTTNSLIWKEALNLLSQCPLSETKKRTLIGKWQKRTPAEEAKKDLLAAVRAAAKAGTPDPISYVEAALRKYPVPPDPSTFTATDWQRNVQAAIKTKQWAPNWGPPPGKKNCRLPLELITPQLQSALNQGPRQ